MAKTISNAFSAVLQLKQQQMRLFLSAKNTNNNIKSKNIFKHRLMNMQACSK